MKFLNKFFYFDIKLFLNVLLILGLGLLAIYSVSFAEPGFNNFKRQMVFVVLGLVIFFVVAKTNYGIWLSYARTSYIVALVLMIVVLFLGEEKHGTVGWIGFASYHLQPVEIMKAAVILVLAKYFSKIRIDDKRLRHVLISGAYCLIPAGLTLLQPDFGSAAVLMGIWFIVLLIWGVRRRYLVAIVIGFLVIAASSWFLFLKPYQKERVMVLFNPESDPAGSGYHVLQSMTAIGSGRIYGKGLGYGSQSQLHFLPEAHTDFIYAVIGEELGFVGVGILLVAFLLLFWGIYQIAKRSPDNFGRFAVVGTLAMFFLHFLVNVGMNIGMMPVTGLPLPLVSYGGSALIVEMFLLGVVFNVWEVSKRAEGYK